MTKGFCRTVTAVLLTGTLLSGAKGVSAQSCAVPPTCESLGYTMAAADCNGKKTLKCPFDTDKLYCVTDAGLANVNLGDIAFSDHTTSSPSVFVNKTPIGIVVGKTADSIIVAITPDIFFTQVDYQNTCIEELTVNKPNSDIDTISWEDPNNGNYVGPALPKALLEETEKAIATYDGKKLYSFFVEKFFSNNIYTDTLADFGFDKGQSVCAQKGDSSSYCPDLLKPDEITIKWKTYSEGNDGTVFRFCGQYQTEGTSKGDWYLPTSKDLVDFSDALTTFYEATNGVNWNHPYYSHFSQEIIDLKNFKSNPSYVYLIDKTMIRNDENADMPVSLNYSKKGITPDKYINVFYYEYPFRKVYNTGGRVLCIAKIKM